MPIACQAPGPGVTRRPTPFGASTAGTTSRLSESPMRDGISVRRCHRRSGPPCWPPDWPNRRDHREFAWKRSLVSAGCSSGRPTRRSRPAGTPSTSGSARHLSRTTSRHGGSRKGHFGAAAQSWAINFRVRDLDAMVEQLRGDGIHVEVDPETYPNGRFASLHDPEGNPIQLWQPVGTDLHSPT